MLYCYWLFIVDTVKETVPLYIIHVLAFFCFTWEKNLIQIQFY